MCGKAMGFYINYNVGSFHQISHLRNEIVQLNHRMAPSRWKDDLIFPIWLDGTRRVVPKPTQHFELIQQVHEDYGHFGVR